MIPCREMQDLSDFRGMSQQMIEEMAGLGEVIDVPAGTYLFRVGDPARNYFIVRKGKVILEFEEDGVLQCCEEVGPGMGAGCCCLAGMKWYRCHAYCQESCQLLCWSQSALRHLFNQNSRIGYLMIKALAKKLSKRVPRKVDLPSVANA